MSFYIFGGSLFRSNWWLNIRTSRRKYKTLVETHNKCFEYMWSRRILINSSNWIVKYELLYLNCFWSFVPFSSLCKCKLSTITYNSFYGIDKVRCHNNLLTIKTELVGNNSTQNLCSHWSLLGKILQYKT